MRTFLVIVFALILLTLEISAEPDSNSTDVTNVSEVFSHLENSNKTDEEVLDLTSHSFEAKGTSRTTHFPETKSSIKTHDSTSSAEPVLTRTTDFKHPTQTPPDVEVTDLGQLTIPPENGLETQTSSTAPPVKTEALTTTRHRETTTLPPLTTEASTTTEPPQPVKTTNPSSPPTTTEATAQL